MSLNNRIIRGHRVFGRAILVTASSEDEARAKALEEGRGRFDHAWEVRELRQNQWEVYLSRHEDVYAEND